LPHHNSGITDSWRVPNNSSFAVFIDSANGININQNSINFIINDGNQVYERNLSSNTVRVVKLCDDDDSQVTLLWAVYDRSQDTYENYEFDANVNIRIDAYDTYGNVMNQASYDFNVESEAEHTEAKEPANLPDTGPVDTEDPAIGGAYDTGIQVNSGGLEGAKIVYSSSEAVPPEFAPVDEIPEMDLPGVSSAGMLVHFQPPTIFDTPVKVFIPYPGYTDVSSLSVYFYNGRNWVLACDAEGIIQPAGEGWMVPGSRINHNNGNPSTIEIQVYHFSGIQAGTSSTSVTDGSGDDDSADGGGCFIGTTTFVSKTERHVQILCEFRDKYLLTNNLGRGIVNFYYKNSPPFADYLRRHPGPRKVAEYALVPVTILAYLMLFDRTLLLLLLITFMLITVMYIARCVFIRLEPIDRSTNEFFFRSKGCQWQ